MRIKRGDIYYMDCGERGDSSVTGGVRPVLVIQNDTGNNYSPTTIVAALSASANRVLSPLPTHVVLGKNDGVKRTCVVQCEQIRCVDIDSLGDYISTLSEENMKRVDNALRISLSL